MTAATQNGALMVAIGGAEPDDLASVDLVYAVSEAKWPTKHSIRSGSSVDLRIGVTAVTSAATSATSAAPTVPATTVAPDDVVLEPGSASNASNEDTGAILDAAAWRGPAWAAMLCALASTVAQA